MVDDKNLLVEYADKSLWLKGFSSTNVADGQYINIPFAVEITGTKTYRTAIGRRTVMVAEPFIFVEDEAVVARRAQARRKAAEERARAEEVRKAAAEAAKWRAWTDSNIEAKFSGLVSGEVKLIKRDGCVMCVGVKELSDEDRQWLDNRKRAAR